MLIITQNKKCLLNMEQAGTVFLSSLYGGHEEGKPVKVLASFPLAEDVTESLGEYQSEARAMEVLEEIATEYGNFMKVDGGCNPLTGAYTQPFAFVHPKVYRMPEKWGRAEHE